MSDPPLSAILSTLQSQHQSRRTPPMASVNINNHVKVKLTPEGRSILQQQNRPLSLPDKDGYVKFQLWDLMNVFGEHLYNGCQVPFDENTIFIELDA